MNNELQVFDNPEFGTVRVIMQDGEPWFVAKDVATILGYADPSRAVVQHCKKSNKISQIGDSTESGNKPPVNLSIIPDSDVFRLIMRSNLPSAERFQDWVCEEVLPSIRKTGVQGTTARVDWEGDRTILSTLYSGNQLTLALDNVYRNACGGKSLLGLAESPKLIAPNKQQLLTVTDLGKLHKPPLSSHEMNKLLIATGMQNKIGKSTYIATDEGEKYSEYVDTGKQHHSGKPVRYLSWYASVLDAIED